MNDTIQIDQPFQGRLRQLQGKTLHLFGSIFNPAGPTGAGYIAPTRLIGYWRSPCDCVGCGTYTIASGVMELLRSSDVGLSPLPFDSFGENNTLPAATTRARGRSQIKLRVSAEIGTTWRQFFMDVGQTVEVNAECVCVDYLVPENMYEVYDRPDQEPLPTREGLVIDAQLSVGISRLEETVGATEAIFTTNIFVPLNTQPTIAVPPYAREVTVYQTTPGGAAALWTQWYGDPNVTVGSVQAGVLPWLAGQRRTQQESVIPDVTHLEVDQDASDRFFTLRWVIRP